MSYVEGRSVGMTKYPCSFVVSCRVTPVAGSVTVTLAPAMTAPEGSVTVPTIVPKPCAKALDWDTNSKAKSGSIGRGNVRGDRESNISFTVAPAHRSREAVFMLYRSFHIAI